MDPVWMDRLFPHVYAEGEVVVTSCGQEAALIAIGDSRCIYRIASHVVGHPLEEGRSPKPERTNRRMQWSVRYCPGWGRMRCQKQSQWSRWLEFPELTSSPWN